MDDKSLKDYDAQLKKYIEETLRIKNYKINYQEEGAIPLFYPLNQFKKNKINIGSAGGMTRLSTGYTFLNIQDQSRYIVEVDKNNYSKIEKLLEDNNIYFENIGVTQKDHFELDKDLKTSVKELYEMNNKWYNKFNGPIG